MKYVSIDIETTGINPDCDDILSVGAVIEDTNDFKHASELPSFHYGIIRERISGSTFAINMNKALIGKISSGYESDRFKLCHEHELAQKFYQFLEANGFKSDSSGYISFTVAGKNVGVFDLKFLENLPYWNAFFRPHRRTLDPAILYVDWENDEVVPTLSQCKLRNHELGTVSHDALEDAIDVVELLRKAYVHSK